MPHFGVAHLTGRQTNVFLGGAHQGKWTLDAPAVVVGLARQFHAIAFDVITFTPTVANNQQHRSRT